MEDNNFVLLNSLAMKCLNREEYADFLTVMQKIRDRSIPVLQHLKQTQETESDSQIRYPHELELVLEYKLFQNNQRGERTNLLEYSEIPLLVKVPLDQDPKTILQNICNNIIGTNR